MEKEECSWCEKEKDEYEDGKYNDANNWCCKECWIEHNIR